MPIWRKDDCPKTRIEKDSDGDWCFYDKHDSLAFYHSAIEGMDHPEEDGYW
jgi:hypothetical protein